MVQLRMVNKKNVLHDLTITNGKTAMNFQFFMILKFIELKLIKYIK